MVDEPIFHFPTGTQQHNIESIESHLTEITNKKKA